jgi:hypothetical protein
MLPHVDGLALAGSVPGHYGPIIRPHRAAHRSVVVSRHFLVAVPLLALLAAAPALAFNYGFLRKSVLERLTPEDIAIGSQVTREALDNNEDREWTNPATGATGTIRILGTVDVGSRTGCRRTRLEVTAGGRSGAGTYTLCRTASGAWNFHSQPR